MASDALRAANVGPMRTAALRAAATAVGALPTGTIEFRAAAALRRLADGQVLHQRLRGGARFELDVGDHTQGVAFFSRRYEPQVVAFLASHLPHEGGVMLDVGANVGLIALQVAQRRPHARYECLEPVAANAERLERNRSLNDATSLHVARVAASDRVGTATFKAGGDSGWGHFPWDHEQPATTDQQVQTTTLDAYCAERRIGHIHALKLDIEGAEAAALRGATGLLSAGAIDAIVAEAHLDRRQELERILAPHGFRTVELPAMGLYRIRPRRNELEVGFVRG